MNRRNWLKKSSVALSGLSLLPFKDFALPMGGQTPQPLPEGGEIILTFNESPYGPSEAARKAMAGALLLSNRYQWSMMKELMSAIAAKHKAIADNIFTGAGSTEILDLLVERMALLKGSFVIAEPTFNRWGAQAVACGMNKITVSLTRDKKHDLDAMLAAIKPDTKMIYVCNPNNPTGTIRNHGDLVSFVEKASKKTMVVVDEAYLDYTSEPSLSDMAIKNENLVVVKTFSKIYGLAGARAGYAIAHTNTIEALNNMRSGAGMSISAVSMAGALASLTDDAFVNSSRVQNEKARSYTIEQLERLHIPCIPSHTNFIYFSLANYKKDFFKQLSDSHITGTGIFEEDGKWSRITVGTVQEMERFIAAIK